MLSSVGPLTPIFPSTKPRLFYIVLMYRCREFWAFSYLRGKGRLCQASLLLARRYQTVVSPLKGFAVHRRGTVRPEGAESLNSCTAASGYDTPTPVQKYSIPAVLEDAAFSCFNCAGPFFRVFRGLQESLVKVLGFKLRPWSSASCFRDFGIRTSAATVLRLAASHVGAGSWRDGAFGGLGCWGFSFVFSYRLFPPNMQAESLTTRRE